MMTPSIDKLRDLPLIDLDDIYLRAISATDAIDLYEIGSDKEVTKYLFWDSYSDLKAAKYDLQKYLRRPKEKTPAAYAVVDKTSDKMIGVCDIFFVDWDLSIAEIGFFLSKNYWGRGIAMKCCQQLMKLGFDHFDINKIVIRHIDKNQASKKIIEKCGFTYKKDVYWEEKAVNCPTYEMFQEEFNRLNN